MCTIRRPRTNTPLQAFVTLNDPVYVEAARSLSRRVMREGGTSARERAVFALRLCLSRPAEEAQIAALMRLFESERDHYRRHAEAAKALATDENLPTPKDVELADLAAWTVVANVLLNLDGVLTKG
jgi:hypothetical protein